MAKLVLGISPFLVFIPLAALFLRFRQLSIALKWIGAYIVLCSITGLFSFALWYAKENNFWLLPVQTTLELPLICLAFYTGIVNPKPSSYLFYSVIILFVVYSVFNSLFIQSVYSYNSYSQVTGSLLIIAYAVFFIARQIGETNTANIQAGPMFWVASSILLYYAGTVFLYAFGNIIMRKSMSTNMSLYIFHAFLAGLHYILIAIGFWRTKTT